MHIFPEKGTVLFGPNLVFTPHLCPTFLATSWMDAFLTGHEGLGRRESLLISQPDPVRPDPCLPQRVLRKVNLK